MIFFKMAAVAMENDQNAKKLKNTKMIIAGYLGSYLGRLWCPELIPDIEKFLPVAIFKMATTIPQKIKLRICHNAKCSLKLLSVAGLGDHIQFR